MNIPPNTFEKAAHQAADDIGHWYLETNSPQLVVDHMVELVEIVLATADGSGLLPYKAIARNALDLLGPDAEAADWVPTLARKQHDYGPDNILKFKHRGLTVRIWDKIARLKNLLQRDVSAAIEDETLQDTLWDIVGYCLIGRMLLRGTFRLPLEADLEMA